MATLVKDGARLNSVLDKLVRYDGVVMTWRDLVGMMPENPDKAINDGNIAWSRTRFNRMDGREQEAYEARLNAQRFYSLNSVLVPKIVFDAVEGRLVKNVDNPDLVVEEATDDRLGMGN